MARGWESKSVEDQIQEREAASNKARRPKLTPEEAQIQSQRDGLLMVRTLTLKKLQAACSARHRAHFERILTDIDAQLRALGDSSPTNPF